MTFSLKKKTEILINSLKWLYTRGNNTLVSYDSETIHEAIDEINRLHNERDEARRMYCHMAAQVKYRSENKSTAEHIADSKNWDCYKKDDWKTGDTKQFLGLTEEEVDTIDGWMEENKTNTTDQTTYWILEETSSLYWVFCLHSHLPNTIFTVDTKTLNAALHYTKIARHLAMGIVWVHGVHHVQQNTLEEAKKLWNDIHLRGGNLIYNRIKQV